MFVPLYTKQARCTVRPRSNAPDSYSILGLSRSRYRTDKHRRLLDEEEEFEGELKLERFDLIGLAAAAFPEVSANLTHSLERFLGRN